MTDENVERAFRQHPSFETVDDGTGEFEVTFTPLGGIVTAGEDSADDDAPNRREYRVDVTIPDIDAVVEGETVADVVRDGWFDTLQRRLDDAHTVADAGDATEPTVEREGEAGEEVVVTVAFERADPEGATEDAKAIVEYVEGTWVQGLIPGYDYREPAATFRERATRNDEEGAGGRTDSAGGEDGRSDGPGGTPL